MFTNMSLTLANISLILLAIVLPIIYVLIRKNLNYWTRHKIPSTSALPFVGSFKNLLLLKTNPSGLLQQLYEKGGDSPVFGFHIFNKPALMIRSPDLVKSVLVKDFNLFANRYSSSDPHIDALGGNSLFFVKNPAWRKIRTKLTPIFTSGKIKQMFYLIENVGDELNALLLKSGDTRYSAEVKEICARYTTDVIASCAFGVDANSLRNPDADFRKNGKRIFDFSLYRAVEFMCFFFMPKIASIFRFKLFTDETSTFLRSTMIHIMNEREKTRLVKNDLIDFLITLRNSKETDEIKFSDDMLIAQAAAFFTAGFETSSATISFCLFELSKQQNVQARLRTEIREILKQHGGKITYENLSEMPYLDMVVSETLRLYPILPFLDRQYENVNGDYSLQPYHEFSIPNGMPIMIPAFSIQRDPKYYPNPNKFDPERFADKNNIVPYTYMPFGTGPHNCIGERFGIIQTKIGIINFLRNHYVVPNSKSQHEMEFEPKALMLQSKGGLYMDIVRDAILI